MLSAEFDANPPVRLGGPITRVEWINPHTWIHLDNNDPESTRDPGPWMVEGGTPNTLLRRGINRNSLVLGTDIVVTGYQSKGSPSASRLAALMAATSHSQTDANSSWVLRVLARHAMAQTRQSSKI